MIPPHLTQNILALALRVFSKGDLADQYRSPFFFFKRKTEVKQFLRPFKAVTELLIEPRFPESQIQVSVH